MFLKTVTLVDVFLEFNGEHLFQRPDLERTANLAFPSTLLSRTLVLHSFFFFKTVLSSYNLGRRDLGAQASAPVTRDAAVC